MATYLISYDLRKPGRNYEDLYKEIRSFPNWAHITESYWAVVSEGPSAVIRDKLQAKMDSNDALIVVKSANSGAWFGLSNELTSWLKANL